MFRQVVPDDNPMRDSVNRVGWWFYSRWPRAHVKAMNWWFRNLPYRFWQLWTRGSSLRYDRQRGGWVIHRPTPWSPLVGMKGHYAFDVPGKPRYVVTDPGHRRRIPLPEYWPSITVNRDIPPDDNDAATAWWKQERSRAARTARV